MGERYNQLILRNVENKNYIDLIPLLQKGIPYERVIIKVFECAIEVKFWPILEVLKRFQVSCHYMKPLTNYTSEDIIKLVSNYKIILSGNFIFNLFEIILFKLPAKETVDVFLKYQDDNFISEYLKIKIVSIEMLDLILYYLPETILFINEDAILNIYFNNVIIARWNERFDIVSKRLLSIYGYPFLYNCKIVLNKAAINHLAKAIGPMLNF